MGQVQGSVRGADADSLPCGTLTACVNAIGSSTGRVGKGGLCEWAQTELATLQSARQALFRKLAS